MPESPAGYFLTFATYGSWLHGDVRGSKDRRHNGLDDEVLRRDDFRRAFEAREMTREAVTISGRQRTVVEAAFVETAASRNWRVTALNVRLQHVHVVLAGVDKSPERALNDLKAYATRALRAAGLMTSSERFWSRHGSTRWLWNEEDVEFATSYVSAFQGEDLPGSQWRELLREADRIDTKSG